MNTSLNNAFQEPSTSDQLITDLKKVAEDANRLIKEVGTYPVERLNAARTQVEEKLRLAKLKVADLRDATVDRTKRAADTTHQYVNENPWKALGIVVAATAVTTLLLTRRND
ncbi:MAG: DUF883 domain-containing protein [Pseudomonadota bacterium]